MEKEDLKKMEMDDLIDLILQKDEMVKRLEADMAKIKEEHAQIINKSEGSELMENKDDDKQMAEHDKDSKDDKKMAEHDDKKKDLDEKKGYSMSEQITLAEFNALKEQVIKLKEEKMAIERDQAVNTLLSEGRITPADLEYAHHAYDCSVNGDPKHWARLSSLAPVVQLTEAGHGKSQEALTAESLHEKITAKAKADNITFGEAMKLMSKENPNVNQIILGGK